MAAFHVRSWTALEQNSSVKESCLVTLQLRWNTILILDTKARPHSKAARLVPELYPEKTAFASQMAGRHFVEQKPTMKFARRVVLDILCSNCIEFP